MLSRLRVGVQSPSKIHTPAAPPVKRALSCSLVPSRTFSSPSVIRSHFFTAKRPKLAIMPSHQLVRAYRASNGWYRELPRFTSTRRTVQVIIGLNAIVFGAWTYAKTTHDEKIYRYLNQNAVLSWANVNAQRTWTLVTSAFSHQNFLHFLFNMVSLNAFATSLMLAGGGLGAFHVAALTIGSAATGSLAFLYWTRKTASKRSNIWGSNSYHLPSMSKAGLGASGVVMGFAAAATCLTPWMPMSLMMIPVPIPMWGLTLFYFGVDLYLLGSNDGVGHDAHLGGAAFGIFYYLLTLRRFGGVSQLLRRR